MKKRPTALLLSALLLLLLLAPAVLTRADRAEDLSKKCTYGFSRPAALRDGSPDTFLAVKPGSVLPVSWKSGVPAKSLYVSFREKAVPFTVSFFGEDGTLLSTQAGGKTMNSLFPLPAGTRSLAVENGPEEMTLTFLNVLGEGDVPHVHPFRERPGKADYLIIAAHPDDEVLFLGGVMPVLKNAGKTGFTVICCSKSRNRLDEQLDGAFVLGQECESEFLLYPDYPETSESYVLHTTDKLAADLAALFCLYRPEVVITHDAKGEYGHWAHKMVTSAVSKAVTLAAESGTPWQVKKVYSHLYPENRLVLDVLSPLPAYDGKSAFETAAEAFRCHKSQLRSGHHAVKNEGIYSLSDFGLAFSAVGPDTEGLNDMFEHIG